MPVNSEIELFAIGHSLDRPSMHLGKRIDERRAEIGISQAELARRVGIRQSTMNSLINGNSRTTRSIVQLARELQTSPSYLMGETDDPDEGALLDPTPEQITTQLDLVAVKSIDLAYGMGGTYTDVPFEEEVLHFPRSWIEKITSTPPEMLTWALGRGDSMSPTINDNDMVLIDRSQRRVREQDVIWAISLGDIGMIKRLRLRAEGVTILSDNDRVPPAEATGDEVSIVGRIIYIGHSI